MHPAGLLVQWKTPSPLADVRQERFHGNGRCHRSRLQSVTSTGQCDFLHGCRQDPSGHWFEKRSCRYSDLGFDLGDADELKATDVAVRRQPGLLASYLSWIQLALHFVSPAYPLSRD
ncbi:hypothetical protein PCAR4_350226 [Paraburkholderia caribensis]|nr:hypothetical protein PCAR4_350226 [Paraburkholderia caribensis]